MKMKLEYAQKILDGGYAFGNRFFSCHDDMFVVLDNEDSWVRRDIYFGTQLKDGKLVANAEGYVIFSRVSPVIDENTRFSF